MAPVGDIGKQHVGAAVLHFGGGLGRQQVGIRTPDQGQRQARQRFEEGPKVWVQVLRPVQNGVAQLGVVIEVQTLGVRGIVAFCFLGPARLRDVCEAGEPGGQGRPR